MLSRRVILAAEAPAPPRDETPGVRVIGTRTDEMRGWNGARRRIFL